MRKSHRQLQEEITRLENRLRTARAWLTEIRSQAQVSDAKHSNLRNGWLIQVTTEALEGSK